MVKTISFRISGAMLLTSISLVALTGCPGPGDRMRFDETTQVTKQGENVCFYVNNAQDYQLADIGINPRDLPIKEREFDFSPALRVVNGMLCIPPSFYHFPEKGQFIIQYILKSKNPKNEPRSVVVTAEVSGKYIYNVTPTEMEIALPYCRFMDKQSSPVITGTCLE
ncbi:hypothetical protein PT300_10535 [Enterobacteriaceae bacterium ESL0689]|nr:hypothetical protein [Enterobacteriaceae bacterium ESL0689]